MGTGYTRNDTPNNIADGNVINASDLDGEFDAVQAAFNGSTGHSHDGTTGEGPQIATAGLADNAVTTAKITDANVTTAKIADDAVTSAKLDTNIQIAGTLGVTGETTLTTHLNMGDNDIIKLGASADLQLFHDGSNSYVKDVGTGSLILTSDGVGVNIQKGTSEIMAQFIADGANIFKYDNSTKLQTTATGIDVTGVITTDGMTTSADINFGDNDKAIFGAGDDLQIYHDGSQSYISEQGTGHLNVLAENFRVRNPSDTENMLVAVPNGAVNLYYDNAIKLATTSTGIDVTGNIANASGDFTLDVAGNIILDADAGLVRLYDGGTEFAQLKNSSSDLQIISIVSDKDIIFRGNDGGSYMNALTLDMSNAGQAIFNKGASFADHVYLADNAKLTLGGGDDGTLYSDGTNIIQTSTGNLTLDVAGDITLDADGEDIRLKDGGTEWGILSNPNGDFGISAKIQDKDVVFYGNDGGSTTELLRLDSSDAGTAIFNHDINMPNSNSFIKGSGHDIVQTDANTTYFYGGANGIQLRKADNSYYNTQFSDDGSVVFNENGNDADFRVESDASPYGLFLDGGSGHVGIHATPTTTSSVYKGVQTGLGGTLLGRTDDTPIYLSSNLTYTDNWKYIANTTGSQIALGTNIQFYTVASGTAGNTATLVERLRITSGGTTQIRTNNHLDILDASDDVSGRIRNVSSANNSLTIEADPANSASGSYLSFKIDTSEVARFDAGGRFIAPYGVTLGTSVGTYVAGNTLDDYEEGTFTPTLNFDGGTTGIAYSSQLGLYTKVGRKVTVTTNIALTNKGSSTGNAFISGMPFTSSSTEQGHTQPYMPNTTVDGRASHFIQASTTDTRFVDQTDAGGASFMTNANFTNTSIIRSTITYFTTT